MRRDQRSQRAIQERKLYKRARWLSAREAQLKAKPLCEWCDKRGQVVEATVCHHENLKSKRSEATFFAGPFVSLCADCHDRDAQIIEKGGTPPPTIGADGWPVQ